MTERITIRTDARQFESFLRSINRCSSLLDARRLKNDITGEIRRTRLLLGMSFCLVATFVIDKMPANHEKDDWINGEKTEDVVAFLDRLYTAKRKVEERISVLGGRQDHSVSVQAIASSYAQLTFHSVQPRIRKPPNQQSPCEIFYGIPIPCHTSWSSWIVETARFPCNSG